MVGSARWYEDVSLDSLDCREELNRHVFKARIKHALSKDRVSDYMSIEYFELFLPRVILLQLVEWSNIEIEDPSEKICLAKLHRFIACILAMTLQPESNIERY
jgi:hypothetical protein